MSEKERLAAMIENVRRVRNTVNFVRCSLRGKDGKRFGPGFEAIEKELSEAIAEAVES